MVFSVDTESEGRKFRKSDSATSLLETDQSAEEAGDPTGGGHDVADLGRVQGRDRHRGAQLECS